MKLLFTESEFWDAEQGKAFKAKFSQVFVGAFERARKTMPFVSEKVNFVIYPNAYESIPETGEAGFTRNSELVLACFDPAIPHGLDETLKNIENMIFHELNHAGRWHLGIWHNDFLDSCIMEGLATVYADEQTSRTSLWARYEQADAQKWLKEIQDNLEAIDRQAYMFEHPDGRRWIGYKVGVYLIQQAMQKSGKSVEELTQMECKDIIRLAGI